MRPQSHNVHGVMDYTIDLFISTINCGLQHPRGRPIVMNILYTLGREDGRMGFVSVDEEEGQCCHAAVYDSHIDS